MEVLVVVGVVLLLLALLVPSLTAARERVRRVVCANNLHHWGATSQYYRDDYGDYLPTEGTYFNLEKPYSWFNVLPPYLDAPAYCEIERIGGSIREFPELHVWICPSKLQTAAYKSGSGKNQFHYGMNQVLDGIGSEEHPSTDAPGFPDQGDDPIWARVYAKHPHTVFMFDIAPNSPAGTPRSVATQYQRSFSGGHVGKFHGDSANVLYLNGAVGHCRTDDLVTGRNFRDGDVRWNHPELYWGYRPP
jgi:hypothetical protein